jgi:cobalt-zinc-cadmium efflux system outer membrane protein
MLRRFLPLLTLALGCQAPRAEMPAVIEANVGALAPPGSALQVAPPSRPPCAVPVDQLDLPLLWGLALANNPALREASADVEAARGRLIQAGLYPNPRFRYNQDTIGSRIAPQGNFAFELTQEIVTAGKRKLDRAIAGQETTAAGVALVTRKFDTLTRIRRAWYDVLSLRYSLTLAAEAVATLERGVEAARRQVEKAGTRPRTDLMRLEALLAEARINQARTRDALDGACKQLAAEVGVPELPPAERMGSLPEGHPGWDGDTVLNRVLAVHTTLRHAAVEVERARLAVQRARAGAIPNITVGGGWTIDNTDQTAGGAVSIEAPLPVWDRQQGVIHEAQARLAAARAVQQSAVNRLSRETASAFANYRMASRQVDQLARDVLPRLEQSLDLLLKAYQAGSAQATFSDVLTAEQNLNSTRLTLADARRSMWQAIADLEGLMQLDLFEQCGPPR